MKTYLEDMCHNLNIKLKYVDNAYTILSSNASNNHPVIQAYHIFRDCPKEVAAAIIKFYTEYENKDTLLTIINKFASEYFPEKNFEILSPKEEFSILISDFKPNSSMEREKTQRKTSKKQDKSYMKDEDMVEANIKSIQRKDFFGDEGHIDPQESIKPSNDDVVELDVVIDNTYSD